MACAGERRTARSGSPTAVTSGRPSTTATSCATALVSADREPHPLLAELAALTQPVAVEMVGRGRLRVSNRRWFTDLADLDARWELIVDGRRVGRGRFEVPAIGPQSSAVVPMPAPPDAAGPGRATLVVRFTPRRRRRLGAAGLGGVGDVDRSRTA